MAFGLGFHYFPVDELTFLSVQNAVNALQFEMSSYDTFDSMAFMYDGHLIWASIEQETMLRLYQFLRLREQDMCLRTKEPTEEQTTIWVQPGFVNKSLRIWGNYGRCTRPIGTHYRTKMRKGLDSKPDRLTPQIESDHTVPIREGFITVDGGFISACVSGFLAKIWRPKIFGQQPAHDRHMVLYQDDRVTLLVLLCNVVQQDDDVFDTTCQNLEKIFQMPCFKKLSRDIGEQFCRAHTITT